MGLEKKIEGSKKIFSKNSCSKFFSPNIFVQKKIFLSVFEFFFKTNYFLCGRFEFRMIPAFIWYTYCLCRWKSVNFQKFWLRRLGNSHNLTKLFCRFTATKICNIWQFSKTPWVQKDAIFHLRPFLTDLDVKYALRKRQNPAGGIRPPHSIDRPKSPPWLGLTTASINSIWPCVSMARCRTAL